MSTNEWKLYNYTPLLWVNLVQAGKYALLLSVLIGLMIFVKIKYNKYLSKQKLNRYLGVMIPFTIGLAMECIGYIGRAMGHSDPQNLGAYILQSLCLLLGPTFMAASIYMLFGEIVKTLDASHLSIIPITKLTKIFVAGDILSLLLQSGGGGLMALSSKADFGEKLVIGGLTVQLIFFGCFMVCVVLFFLKCSRYPTKLANLSSSLSRYMNNWKVHLLLLVIASLLIFARSIYRLLEFVEGRDGKLMSSEEYLFLLDSLFITFAALTLLSFYTPMMLSQTEMQFKNVEREDIALTVTYNADDSKPTLQAEFV